MAGGCLNLFTDVFLAGSEVGACRQVLNRFLVHGHVMLCNLRLTCRLCGLEAWRRGGPAGSPSLLCSWHV